MQMNPIKAKRPLKEWSATQIRALAAESVKWKNNGVAMLCAEETSHRKTLVLKSVIKIIQSLDIPP